MKQYEHNRIFINILHNSQTPQEMQDFLTYINYSAYVKVFNFKKYNEIDKMDIKWEDKMKLLHVYIQRRKILIEKIK